MKIPLVRITVLTHITLAAFGMDRELTSRSLLLHTALARTIVAISDGNMKNALAKTCKALHDLASFTHKDTLVKHPLIHLGTIEKHLLLLEYVENNNLDMVNHMFALGATCDLAGAFGQMTAACYIPRSQSMHYIYIPHYRLFPKNRIPYTCIDTHQSMIHICVIKKQYSILKIVLDQIKNHGQDYINMQDKNRNTPLQLAVETNDAAITQLMLDCPALDPHTVHITNNRGFTPLTYAQHYQLNSIADLLRNYELQKEQKNRQ